MAFGRIVGGTKLFVGGDSEIGAAARAQFRREGISILATTRRKDHVASDRPFLDLARGENWTLPTNIETACILAGVPRILACHQDPEGSAFINVTQTMRLIDRLLTKGIYVLFPSSNQVFDGTRPSVEADAPVCPVSEYGRQKVSVENFLQRRIDCGARAAILRFGKVVTSPMPLIQQWINDLIAGRSVFAFNDMKMAPVPVTIAVTAIGALMSSQACGIFQLTGPEDVAYEEVARHIAHRIGAPLTQVFAVPAASSLAGMPDGSTPTHTTLDSKRLFETFGILVPGVWEVIDSLIRADV